MKNTDAKINYNDNTIVITKAFAKKATNPTTDEFKELMKLRKTLEGFEVVVKTTSKRRPTDPLTGLNYEFMKQYISRHDDENGTVMAEFTKMTVKDEDNLATLSYGKVKKWFLEKYPEIKTAA